MGNNMGRGKKAKVMKIDGETFKLNAPAKARDAVKDYPGHVLYESEAVKIHGIHAKPIEPEQELYPKRTYFLVELPNYPQEKVPPPDQHHPTITRRVKSGIQMTAKDRLELLKLSRRSISDLSVLRPMSVSASDPLPDHHHHHHGPIRLKIRLPRKQVERLVGESKDDVNVAQKIVDLVMEKSGHRLGDRSSRRYVQWKPELGSIGENHKPREV